MKQSPNILLSGGGTGGHIYPAISIANELKKRYPKAKFLFVGAKDRMEMEKVPQAGYEIIGLDISGIQRSLSLKNFSFPIRLLRSLKHAGRILREFKPDVVIGTGGFASGPTLYVANKNKIPTVIQEQNSYPGITNKILAKNAFKICVAYDGLEAFFPKNKIQKTGNPVREDLMDITSKRDHAIDFFKLDSSKPTLVVVGGSLGSGKINEAIDKNLKKYLDLGVQIIWQTGKYYFDKYKHHNKELDVQTLDFIQRMDLLFAASDVIISRAGAGTISELCLVGKPVVFIPSPNVAEDHQTKNAKAVVDKEAAIMVKEEHIEELIQVIKNLISDAKLRERLGENIKKLALPNATQEIADVVLEAIK